MPRVTPVTPTPTTTTQSIPATTANSCSIPISSTSTPTVSATPATTARWTRTPHQTDSDADLTGNRCDINDGKLTLAFDARDTLAWDEEGGFDEWIAISGDLSLLRSGGGYVQDPASTPLAVVECGAASVWSVEGIAPEPGQGAFFLAGGATGIFENGFGVRPDGTRRIVADVCP